MLGSIFGKNKEQKRRSKQEQEEKKTLGKVRFIFFINLAINSFADDVLSAKDSEKKKLEKEEQEFQQKKRERERKIIQIEKEELDQREDEVLTAASWNLIL